MPQSGSGKFGRFLNASVMVNSVDLSAFVRSVSIEGNTEILDQSAMGDTTRVKVAGTKEWSVSIDFYQSYYTSEVDQTLWGLHDGGTAFTIAIVPENDTVSDINPEYSGSAILPAYQPIAGSWNDILASTVNFESAGALTRSTTP